MPRGRRMQQSMAGLVDQKSQDCNDTEHNGLNVEHCSLNLGQMMVWVCNTCRTGLLGSVPDPSAGQHEWNTEGPLT